MSKNEPQSLAELEQWDATVKTMEEADRAAGITDKGTAAARAAYEAATNGRQS